MRTDDSSIIQACLNGEPEAFGVLVDKYKAGIYAYVYSRIRNFHETQEITQEIFISAFRGLYNLKRHESFSFWLFRIASNQCKKWTRNQIRHPQPESIENMDQETLNDSSTKTYREEMLDQSVREALDSLPETYREVLMLYYFSDMDSNEIAESLGISPTAIRMRLSRARLQFKEEMLAMMDKSFGERKLNASFTFRIVEAIKRIKIQPISQPRGLPWGLSIATGLIITILSINPAILHLDSVGAPIFAPLPSETKVLRSGEIPVDTVKVSDMPMLSSMMGKGKGGELKPDMQNAFLMAPQAEGGIWIRKADMITPRFGLSTSVVNSKIYAIGGKLSMQENALATVDEYDPVMDSWTKKTDMPTPRYALSTVTLNGKIYAIGGSFDGINMLSVVEEYNPKKDIWTRKADMLSGRYCLAAVAANGRIYAIGGVDNNLAPTATVEEYDPVEDVWVKRSNMPTERMILSACAVNGKIYAIGGLGGGINGQVVEEYDSINDRWERKKDMPTGRGSLSASVADDKIYAIGGTANFANNPVFSIVEEYDPVNDIWSKKADMLTARHSLSTSEINGKIYAIGGMLPNSERSGIVEEYTPESWSVSSQGKLPSSWGQQKEK